jgi:YegS/Rv2252/BmrU family lipid kinase
MVFGPDCQFRITDAPRAAVSFAREASANGCRLLIVVGGDGTIHEVVNGLLRGAPQGGASCELGIISSGTGCGLAMSLHLPRSVCAQSDVIANGITRRIDVGKVAFRTSTGTTEKRFFVSECQVGIGSAIAVRLSSSQKRLGGLSGYTLAAMCVATRYQGGNVTLDADSEPEAQQMLDGISVGNGNRCAGGMRLTPDACLDDGLLDALFIRRHTAFKRFLCLPSVYLGWHTKSPGFEYRKIRRISITSESPMTVAADGEWLGYTPCEIEIQPSELAVRVSRSDRHHVPC